LVGRSKTTETKQRDLSQIFIKLINAINPIYKNYELKRWNKDKYIWVFDLNAGDGIGRNGEMGSSMILLDILTRHTKYPCQLILIEKDSSNFSRLSKNINSVSYPDRINISLMRGRQQEILPNFFSKQKEVRFGLCYQDFNGCPDYNILKDFSEISCYRKNDILINVSTGAIARTAGLLTSDKRSFNVRKECRQPKEGTKTINKKHWVYRKEKTGKYGWQLFLGTNWNACPSFKSIGFTKTTNDNKQGILPGMGE